MLPIGIGNIMDKTVAAQKAASEVAMSAPPPRKLRELRAEEAELAAAAAAEAEIAEQKREGERYLFGLFEAATARLEYDAPPKEDPRPRGKKRPTSPPHRHYKRWMPTEFVGRELENWLKELGADACAAAVSLQAAQRGLTAKRLAQSRREAKAREAAAAARRASVASVVSDTSEARDDFAAASRRASVASVASVGSTVDDYNDDAPGGMGGWLDARSRSQAQSEAATTIQAIVRGARSRVLAPMARRSW